MELVLALDLKSKEENLELVRSIKEHPIWLKVGMRSFIRDGKEIIDELKEINSEFKIFVDLKLYDIPNTLADGAKSLAELGVDMITIHASSGRDGLESVVNRLKDTPKRPLIMAVTALTSFDDKNFKEVYGSNIEEKIYNLSILAYESGVDGVVSSVWEAKKIKELTSSKFLTLTPGIRPFGESSDDQKRVGKLEDAKKACSDFIVIGRPIYSVENKKEILEKILDKMARL